MTTAFDDALQAGIYRPEIFVKIVFPSYTFLAWSGTGPYTLDGDAYTGVGSLGSISAVGESSDLTADGADLNLSGLNSNLVSSLQDFDHQGSPVTIQLAMFDAARVIIPDPETIFAGIVDTMSFVIGETLDISVRCDSILTMLFRGPDGGRRMQAQQIQICPADLGLEFSAGLKEDIPWGVATKLTIDESQRNLYRRGGWHF